MRRPLLLALALAAAAAAALAAGCGIADPYADGVPSAATTPTPTMAVPMTMAVPTTTAAPATTATAALASAGAPARERGQDQVLARFAQAWSTWSAKDLVAQRRVLIGLATEPLAAHLRADAQEALRDALERTTSASSTGRLVGTIPQKDGTIVVVTYETAKAEGQTEGQPAYQVYLAAGHDTPAGWRLSRWEPTA